MEETSLKINNLEISCQSLIEFTSLTKVLLELIKKQKDINDILNSHDIKINELEKKISSNEWRVQKIEVKNPSHLSNDKDQLFNNLNEDINEANINELDDMLNDLTVKTENEGKEVQKKSEHNENEPNENINKDTKIQEIMDVFETKKTENISFELPQNVKNADNKNILITENILTNEDLEKIDDDEEKKQNQKEEIKTEDNKNEENKNEEIKNEENKNENDKQEEVKTPKEENVGKKDLSGIKNRFLALEKNINELAMKEKEHVVLVKNIKSNRIGINNNTNDINLINQNMKKELKKINDEIKKMNEKIKELNFLDELKDGEEADMDKTRGMLLALENKFKKRFDLMDEKYKIISADNFKNKNDIFNLLGKADNYKLLIDKNGKQIEDLLILIESSNKNLNLSNELKEKASSYKLFNGKIEEMNQNIDNFKNENNNKLNEIQEKLKNIKEEIKNEINPINEKKFQKINENFSENENNLNSLIQRIIEIEKGMKIILKKWNIDEIKANISHIQNELSDKSPLSDVILLRERVNILNEIVKDLSSKSESLLLIEQRTKDQMSYLSKQVEKFTSDMRHVTLNSARLQNEDKVKFDPNKFLELNVFDGNKKEVNKKFDQIRNGIEDILRTIDDILNKLSHTPSDSDFAQYQEVVKNMMDELKLAISKKYSDKHDTNKNFKFLETQIKLIQDNYEKKLDGQENWLLAKKPMSNFLCASCESVLKGELDKRSDYIPWNKYPFREEKYSRMGHGFSHMLQLVNDDIRKNVESKEREKNDEKGYHSDEDKKKNDKDIINSSKLKLPKVRQRPRNINNLNTLEEVAKEKFNSSPYDDKNIEDYTNISPQIIKISKIKINNFKKSITTLPNYEEVYKKGINLKTETSINERKKGDLE